MSDKALIADFLEGRVDSAATMERWVRRAAFPFRTRLSSEWDDCVQDCLLELTRLLRSDKFRGKARLRTYVWRITVNACIDNLRQRTQSAHQLLDELSIPTEDPSPLAATLGKEFGSVALRIFRRMPAACRELWAMIMDGVSYQEMGQRLDVKPGALRVRVHRCRQQALELRQELEAQGGLEGV